MKNIALIIFLILSNIVVYAQSTEAQIDTLLYKIANGENIEGMVVNIRDVQFETASSTLVPSTQVLLSKVIVLLQRLNHVNLIITGHSDDIGNEQMNMDLSLQRASNVKKYLVQNGILENRLTTYGKGESQPLVDNISESNRAINRRVEFEIIRTKQEEIVQIQDIIHYRNGDVKGVIVQIEAEDKIEYEDIQTGITSTILISEIDFIAFSDGRIVHYNQDVPVLDTLSHITKEEKKVRDTFRISQLFSSFNRLSFLLEEAPQFQKGTKVWSVGLGLGNNASIHTDISTYRVPPLQISYEKAISKINNVGLGFSVGAFVWQPENQDISWLQYYTFSPRATYHINLGNKSILNKIDCYTGMAINGRMGIATIPEIERTFKHYKIDAGVLAGIRYYFKSQTAFYFERGCDGVACNKLGLSFRFNKN